MDNHKKSYTLEFKAKVVLEAVSGDEVRPREVAEKYDVTPEQILLWAREMNISDENLEKLAGKVGADSSANIVELDTTDDVFVSELQYGASYDTLNLKNLLYWGVFGTVFVIVIVILLFVLFDYSDVSTAQQAAVDSDYREIMELRQHEQETLTTFGVVDPESGVYRIPVDSVITRMSGE